ncbi:MAG TPA: OmpA family protein [Myxococcota bacterium]|nr:OmpA family protein [Myxococcota bacterium]
MTVGVAFFMGGCVTQTKYNAMLSQQQQFETTQQQLESALQTEVSSQQAEIKVLENGIQVRLSSDLLYASGAVELGAAGRAAIDKVAGKLASQTQTYEIDVIGNTDNVPIGPELAERYPSNWELAGARAAIVVRRLQERGVDPSALRSVSDGQYHPVGSNDTAAGRAQNRRTDILLRPRQ